MVPVWGIYPGYFGYSAVPAPFFPNVIPQPFQPHPLFAYNVYTPHGAAATTSGAVIPPAPMAKSIYTTPDDTFRGYSFQTEYEGGGKSEVVFVTGPQANQILQKSVDLFRTIVPTELTQLTGRSLTGVNSTNTTDTSATPPAASPISDSSLASFYRLQLYPASTSPFMTSSTPFQNLVSSFAYSITNDVTNSIKDAAENAGEAQESMIHEVGAAVTVPSPSQNTTTSAATTSPSPSEAITTTVPSITSTTENTTAEAKSSSTTSDNESNEVTEANTTVSSDEIMETTST